MARARYLLLLISVILLSTTLAHASFVADTSTYAVNAIPGGSLPVGDKVFSNFDFFGFAVGEQTQPSASSLFVQGGHDSVTGDYGLRFITSWAAGVGQQVSTDLTFDVAMSPTANNQLIDGVSMRLIGVSATGDSTVAVGETVLSSASDTLAVLSLSKQAGDGNAFLYDQASIAPSQSVIQVLKNFSVVGGTTSGAASVTQFYQYYSTIPEPASMALLAVGAVGTLLRRRR